MILLLWDRKGKIWKGPTGASGMLYGVDFRIDVHRGTRLYLMKLWNSHTQEPPGLFMPAYWTWA